jgi:hypothetical protein
MGEGGTGLMRIAHAGLRALALLVALGAASPALADTDRQLWGAATLSIAASDRVVIWLDVQGRVFDDASRLTQTLVRPGVGYRLSPTTTLFAGYAFVRTRPEVGAATNEHRVWQQASFRVAGDGRGPTLTGRSRLEQRFVEGRGDTGVRARQMLRLTAPLTQKGVQAVGSSEAFFGLNETSWGQRAGLDRWRNLVGVSFPAGRALRIEPGYMNEIIARAGEDRMNHIGSVTLNLSL